MRHEPGQPFPRTPEQIRQDLEQLRKDNPAGYALQSARLLKELERSKSHRQRTALT